MKIDLKKVKWDPGSFRDPAGHVFFYEDEVYRTVNSKNIDFVKKLLKSSFLKKYIRSKHIIGSSLEDSSLNLEGADFYILKHDKIDFITYPYEFSFLMLKEAALLTLDILEAAIKEGFILKDGSAWNITYHKGNMCFYDVLSFDEYREGQFWEGYKQFCEEFLYPLMLKAYKKIDFQPHYKGNISGIPIQQAGPYFKITDLLKPGIFKHVFLNHKLSSNKTIENTKIYGKLKISKQQLLTIVRNLKSTVLKLKLKNSASLWSGYTNDNTYTSNDSSSKKNFIHESISEFNSIIDIGCNTGEYSLHLPNNIDSYACDLDNNCIDRLFIKTTKEHKNITPFVLDLSNPSPDCGWALAERKSIFSRLKVEGFLALALIHHVCIGSNVPISFFLELLSKTASKGGVIEWVDKKDPMVEFLLSNRKDIFDNYTWEHFYEELKKYFDVIKTAKINEGNRTLCFVKTLK